MRIQLIPGNGMGVNDINRVAEMLGANRNKLIGIEFMYMHFIFRVFTRANRGGDDAGGG